MNEIRLLNNKKCEDEIISLIEMIYPKIKSREKDTEYRKLAIQKCLRNLNLSVFEHSYATFYLNIPNYIFEQLFINSDLNFSCTVQEITEYKYDIPTKISSNSKHEMLYTGIIKKIEQLKKECNSDNFNYFIPKCIVSNVVVSSCFLNWFKFLRRYHKRTMADDSKIVISTIYEKLHDVCPLFFNEPNFNLRI